MPTVTTTALFTWPLGDDAVLIPRTAAIAEAQLTAVLDHAFGPLGLERVGLPTTVDNTRSRSVAEPGVHPGGRPAGGGGLPLRTT